MSTGANWRRVGSGAVAEEPSGHRFPSWFRRGGRRPRWSLFILVLLVAVGVAGGILATGKRFAASESKIPIARVERGSLKTTVYAEGELRPVGTAMLMAPPVGGSLRITHLLKTGTTVKSGELVIEFDPAEQEHAIQQSRSELLQAEQEIQKGKADAEVQAAKDQVDLLKAKFDVRRAELEVSRNELVSVIDAKKNMLALDEARRRLAQLQEDIKSRTLSSQATIAVQEEKRNKAKLAMQQAEEKIESMHVRSPMDGIVSVKQNQEASGGFFYPGIVLPEFREGDTAWPGSFVAEILDTQHIEIQAKVNELDRAHINSGQAVEVRVDALPGQVFPGKVKSVAGIASRNWWMGEAVQKFDATFEMDHGDARLRPGLTAQVIIGGAALKDALLIPRQALFDKDEKPVVYVKFGNGFQATPVKVKSVSEAQASIEGLREGTEVALVNPERQSQAGQKSAPLTPPNPGGPP